MAINAPEPGPTLTELAAEEIRALLGRKKRSGRWLAAALGESQTWISKRLSGKTPIDLNDLDRIAQAMGVDVTDLLPPKREGRIVAAAEVRSRSDVTRAYQPPTNGQAITPTGPPSKKATSARPAQPNGSHAKRRPARISSTASRSAA